MKKTRKLIFTVLTACFAVSLFLLAGCLGTEVTVTYDCNYIENDEEVFAEQAKYNVGDVIELPVPERDKMTFEGWYKDATLRKPVSEEDLAAFENVTFYAKWSVAKSYKIRFDGATTGNMKEIDYPEGAQLLDYKPADPVKIGHAFRGWYTYDSMNKKNVDFDFETSAVTRTVTLFAKWERDITKCVVTFNVYDDIYSEIAVNKPSTVPEIEYKGERQGFTFWADANGTEYDFSNVIDEDITLYARFQISQGEGNEIKEGQFAGNEDIIDVVLPDTVESIGSGAFENCINLISVEIPSNVTEIPADCFSGCEKLRSVNFKGNITAIGSGAFFGCESLTSVKLPSTVIRIERNAFSNCTSLTSFDIPDNVTKLGKNAFAGCSKLEKVTLPDSMSVISEGAFRGCNNLSIKLPTTVKGVENYAFFNSRITGGITANVTSIGEYAFYGCTGLTSVVIGKEVASVGDYAFFNCSEVKSLIFETYTEGEKEGTSDLRSIGVASFGGMAKIPEAILPEGLTHVIDDSFRYEYGAFASAISLKKVYIPSTITVFGKPGGNGSAMFYNCTSLADVTLADGLTLVGGHMFHGCSSLKNIFIPASVTSLGWYMFNDCANLESVVIGAGSVLTTIPGYCFAKCSSLKELTLPDSVEVIGGSAFADCTSLSKLNSSISGEFRMPKSLRLFEGTAIFRNCTSLTSVFIDSDSENGIEFSQYATSMFNGCTNLTAVTFGEHLELEILRKEMFRNCAALVAVNNLPSVTIIEDAVFNGCTSLESIFIPKSVTTIGTNSNFSNYGVFGGSGLKTVTFEDNITISEINPYTFALCANLENFNLPDSVAIICEGAFRQSGLKTFATSANSSLTDIEKYAFYQCERLVTVYLPTVKNIKEYVFNRCSSLKGFNSETQILVPATLESIGTGLFGNCLSAKDVVWNFVTNELPAGTFNGSAILRLNSSVDGTINIPEYITTIGPTVFQSVTGITNVNVTSQNFNFFGIAAFRYCSNLSSVTIEKNVTDADGVPTASSELFVSCSSALKVYVPQNSADFYRNNEYWTRYDYVKYLAAIS